MRCGAQLVRREVLKCVHTADPGHKQWQFTGAFGEPARQSENNRTQNKKRKQLELGERVGSTTKKHFLRDSDHNTQCKTHEKKNEKQYYI